MITDDTIYLLNRLKGRIIGNNRYRVWWLKVSFRSSSPLVLSSIIININVLFAWFLILELKRDLKCNTFDLILV